MQLYAIVVSYPLIHVTLTYPYPFGSVSTCLINGGIGNDVYMSCPTSCTLTCWVSICCRLSLHLTCVQG